MSERSKWEKAALVVGQGRAGPEEHALPRDLLPAPTVSLCPPGVCLHVDTRGILTEALTLNVL